MLLIFERVTSENEKLQLAINPASVIAVFPIYDDRSEILISAGSHKISYAVSESFATVIERLNTNFASGDSSLRH